MWPFKRKKVLLSEDKKRQVGNAFAEAERVIADMATKLKSAENFSEMVFTNNRPVQNLSGNPTRTSSLNPMDSLLPRFEELIEIANQISLYLEVNKEVDLSKYIKKLDKLLEKAIQIQRVHEEMYDALRININTTDTDLSRAYSINEYEGVNLLEMALETLPKAKHMKGKSVRDQTYYLLTDEGITDDERYEVEDRLHALIMKREEQKYLKRKPFVDTFAKQVETVTSAVKNAVSQ